MLCKCQRLSRKYCVCDKNNERKIISYAHLCRFVLFGKSMFNVSFICNLSTTTSDEPPNHNVGVRVRFGSGFLGFFFFFFFVENNDVIYGYGIGLRLDKNLCSFAVCQIYIWIKSIISTEWTTNSGNKIKSQSNLLVIVAQLERAGWLVGWFFF